MPQNLKAISLPFRFDASGYPAPAFGDDVLRDMIRTILLTKAGERVMRPTYGSFAHLLLFDNINGLNQAIAARVEFELRRAVREWEPRVSILGVEIALSSDRATVTASVSWRGADNQTRTSTVPLGVNRVY